MSLPAVPPFPKVWVEPLAKAYGMAPLSAYFLADVFFELDIQLKGCLLRNAGEKEPDDPNARFSVKQVLALREGNALKSVMTRCRRQSFSRDSKTVWGGRRKLK